MADARDEMRASDADRTSAGETLRRALDEGRLDFHEYDERLREAYQAKTYGDLNRLMADLPAAPARPEEQQLVPRQEAQPAVVPAAAHGGHTGRWLNMMWQKYVFVVGICTLIWLVGVLGSRHLYYFWPIWVAGPWGIVLLVQSVGGLRHGEPQRWAEKRARKAAKRERKRARRQAGSEATGY
jgi:Domain of unknown function (DUF1707)